MFSRWIIYFVQSVVMIVILGGCSNKTISKPILLDTRLTILENIEVGHSVGSVNIQSDGGFPIIEFRLTGEGANNFIIDIDGNIVIAPEAILDYETKSIYHLQAVATNSAGDSASVSVDIAVNDIADVVPTLSDFSTSVDENISVGTVVGSVTVSSSGDSAITSFELNDSATFEINASGAIKTKVTLDYETQTTYNIQATATNDAGQSTPVAVDILIDNIAELAPSLSAPSSVSILESASIGTHIATMELNGTQADQNITDSYSIASGDGDSQFSIDSSGEIVTTKALDYTTHSSYDLEIVATNSAGDSNHITQHIAVTTAPTASDFKMTLDITKAIVMANYLTSSSATDEDGDSLTATVSTQGAYGICIVSGDKVAYWKTTETNSTDTCTLEISDGENTVSIDITIISLYWKQVSAGCCHTVAIKSDGTLWTWGRNKYGQLGDDTTINSPNPVQESSKATNWSSVSARGYHTVALQSDGTLWAWGCNNNGQLGDGTTKERHSPTHIGSSTEWSSISTGYYHTVALHSDGSLWAWGDNYYGQLGDGTTKERHSPTHIGSSTGWSSISTGSFHTVAL